MQKVYACSEPCFGHMHLTCTPRLHRQLHDLCTLFYSRLTQLCYFFSFVDAYLMGVLDHFYAVFDMSYWRHARRHKKALKKNKLRQLQKIEIRIKMDCEGCERRVRQAAETMKRVTKVEVNTKQHKLTVMGYVEPEKVLKRIKARTGKAAQFWPYVPYDIVPHPYAVGSYDKKAPAGHVRNVVNDPGKAGDLARVNSMEARIISAFSEDNTQACVVM